MKPSGVKDIIGTTFATTYSWAVDFPNFPNKPGCPYGIFVSKVTESIASIQEKRFNVGHVEFSIPLGVGVREITITAYDNDQLSFLNTFIKTWARSIEEAGDSFGRLGATGVARVGNFTKMLTVTKFDSTGDGVISHTKYMVYPYGGISYVGTSESQALQTEFKFRVVSETE